VKEVLLGVMSDHTKPIETEMVKKMTWHILPYLFLLYVLSFLDRANLGNAHEDLLKDTGMTEEEYSWGVSIFFVGYILFEIPSNLLLKLTTAPRWFARIMVTWGILSCCMMFVKDIVGLLITRLLLGIAEAGFLPGVVYYLSSWFTPSERAFRIGIFLSSISAAGFLAGLAAYGILQMEGKAGLHGWQWLFLLEGAPTVVFGILTWFVLPATPDSVSWLTLEEKKLAKTRLDSIGQESQHSHISKQQILGVFMDVRIWLAACLFFTVCTCVYSVSFFFTCHHSRTWIFCY